MKQSNNETKQQKVNNLTNNGHKFWNQQPVVQENEQIAKQNETNQIINKQILSYKELSTKYGSLQALPYLPKEFEWSELDLKNEEQFDEFYVFLKEHYNQDKTLFYSKEALTWILMTPQYKDYLHVGVRCKLNGALFACVMGIPATIQIYDKIIKPPVIDFLCVHSTLRKDNLAAILIGEITRRVIINDTGIQAALFTARANFNISKPISTVPFWRRSLNDINMNSGGTKLFMRAMVESDCEVTHELLQHYFSKFVMHYNFTIEEFKHYFLSRQNVIYSYVIQNDETLPDKITDFISFRQFGSETAQLYYYAVSSVKVEKIIYTALMLAKEKGYKSIMVAGVMENNPCCLQKLGFNRGKASLNYYLFNWKCTQFSPQKNAIIML